MSEGGGMIHRPERAQPANAHHPLPRGGGWGEDFIAPARPPEGGGIHRPERVQPANFHHPLPRGGTGKVRQ